MINIEIKIIIIRNVIKPKTITCLLGYKNLSDKNYKHSFKTVEENILLLK